MKNLENKNVRNGALVAVDYQTGELVSYVGSAEYYASQSRPEFQPQYDVVGQGFRQPGSAFKPFNYVIGLDDGSMTAGDMFMDVGTDFGGGFTPNDADNLERGPVRMRNALQFSLNIPSVKAMAINTPEHVVRAGQGLRHDVPERHDGRRPGAGTGRGRDPPARPRVRLRDARQRRRAASPRPPSSRSRIVPATTSSSRTRRPRAPRSSARRQPGS